MVSSYSCLPWFVVQWSKETRMQQTLKHLCEEYYGKVDHLTLLQEEVSALEDELASTLELHEINQDVYQRTYGVASYDPDKVMTSTISNSTQMLALLALTRLRDASDKIRGDIAHKKRLIARAKMDTAPVRIAMIRLNEVDVQIIELRFGKVHVGKRPSFEYIAEVVKLDVTTVQDHITRLEKDFPPTVESIRTGLWAEGDDKNTLKIPQLRPRMNIQGVLPLVRSS